MNTPAIVPAAEWQRALDEMLVKEEAFTKARDALAAERRRMPWTLVDKEYLFDGPGGQISLLDLFAGRRQLLVYRAFVDPGVHGWPEHGCVGCSLMADHIGNLAHLNARDTTLVYASRGSQADLARIKQRMGWDIPWYTMLPGENAFDVDFGVDQWHGTNAFIRDGDRVYRTYFIDSRGDEVFVNTWNFLDMTALGRQGSGRIPRPAIRSRNRTNGGAGMTNTGSAPRPAGSVTSTPTIRMIPAPPPAIITR